MKIDGRQWTWHILIYLVHLIGKRDFLCLEEAHIHNKIGQVFIVLLSAYSICRMWEQVKIH